jgi:hypothetical protein
MIDMPECLVEDKIEVGSLNWYIKQIDTKPGEMSRLAELKRIKNRQHQKDKRHRRKLLKEQSNE